MGRMKDNGLEFGFGTFLLKRSPWLPEELDRLREYSDRLDFRRLYAPDDNGSDPVFRGLLEPAAREGLLASYPLDIRPPTDDRPFFFYQMRFADFLKAWLGGESAMDDSDPLHRTLAGILIGLLAASALWVLLLLILPLTWKYRRQSGVSANLRPQLLYFACIGMGFMLIEIPLLQRLTIFLGKPIFAFSVTLFTLLACAGIGSLFSGGLSSMRPKAAHWAFGLLSLGVLVMAYLLPMLLMCAVVLPESVRILTAVLVTAPLGLLLGLPLPMAIGRLAREAAFAIPMAWGINGGCSVLASVLAMLVSINWGLTSTLMLGLVCYLAAWSLWSRFPATMMGEQALVLDTGQTG
jgi:hypothetical protein